MRHSFTSFYPVVLIMLLMKKTETIRKSPSPSPNEIMIGPHHLPSVLIYKKPRKARKARATNPFMNYMQRTDLVSVLSGFLFYLWLLYIKFPCIPSGSVEATVSLESSSVGFEFFKLLIMIPVSTKNIGNSQCTMKFVYQAKNKNTFNQSYPWI